jgi:hypothetical protein
MAEETLSLLLEKNSKGSKTLLKDPHSATHPSWHLWLPSHFNTSLDLRFIWRQQTKNKEVVQKWKDWAQGTSFCFNEGAIIYDRDVSSLETWGEKLDTINFYVVIGPTRPVSLRSGSSLESRSDGGLSRDPGSVNFKIYVPTSDHASVIAHEHTVTQDQFALYSITGRL